MMTLTGLPVSSSSDPALPAKRQWHQQLGRRDVPLHRHHQQHRQERRHRPVEVDQRGHPGRQQHDHRQQRCAAAARAGAELPADPRRHARGVQAFAHHEHGGDQDDGRVAEPGDGLVQVDHTRGPEHEGRADRHDLHRQPVRDEQHDDEPEDHEADDRAVPHAAECGEAAAAAASPVEGEIGGIPAVPSGRRDGSRGAVTARRLIPAGGRRGGRCGRQ